MKEISVLIATNVQGKIEVFAFERASDCERAAEAMRDKGFIDMVWPVHDIEVMDEQAAQRLTFGMRGFQAVGE